MNWLLSLIPISLSVSLSVTIAPFLAEVLTGLVFVYMWTCVFFAETVS